MRYFVVALLLLCFPAASFSGEVLPYRRAVSDLNRAREELYRTKSSVSSEKSTLLAKEASLKREVSSLRKKVKLLQKKLIALREEEVMLIRKNLESDREINELIGEFRIGAKKLRGYLVRSPFTSLDVKSLGEVETFLSKGYLPKIEDIDRLSDIYLSEMERTGKVGFFKASFVGEDGTLKRGDVLFVGPFTAIYRSGGKVGFLRYDESKMVLSSEVPAPSWMVKRVIVGYMNARRPDLYFDISGGGALVRLSHRLTFSKQTRRGGPIAVIILLLGFTAAAIVVERFMFLGGIDVKEPGLMGSIESLARQGRWDDIKSMLKRKDFPLYRVLLSGVEARDEDRDTLEGIMQESIMKELPRIERFLSFLGIIGAISPLLGLLGTVTGMIKTFHAITLFGSTEPRMLSGGISEALITTEFGLMVAIPVLFFHSLISRKVDRIVEDMESKASTLVNIILASKGASSG